MAAGIPVQRTALPLAELASWDEAFITSTNRRIMPVRQIDDTPLRTSPGPVTKQLMAAFSDYEEDTRLGRVERFSLCALSAVMLQLGQLTHRVITAAGRR